MSLAQQQAFDMMRTASFNSFDGDLVVNDLEAHRDLWVGAVMDRLNSLIKLRDIRDGSWNIDTLWIIPAFGKEHELYELASQWNADELDWIGGDEACHLLGSYSQAGRENRRSILRIWWD